MPYAPHPVETMTAAQLAPLRAERWRRQAERVRRGSAFYRRLWDGRPPPERLEDLPALPFTTKDMLRASQADAPPFGDYLAAPERTIRRIHRSSGTTGRASNVALSASDARVYAEVGGRVTRMAGVGPGVRIVHCLNYTLWMGGYSDHAFLEAAGASVVPFGVGNSALLVETLRDLAIDAIYCTPSYPAVLEQVLAEKFPGLAPRDLGLRIGLLSGEPGGENPAFRARLAEEWGLRARNIYGISEIMTCFAGECDVQEDLHYACPDWMHAELVEPQSGAPQPFAAGSVGELVLTHLDRRCQPMVRMRTGDLVEITSDEPCACGRRTPRLRVRGRADDMVIVRGVNVFPGAVAAAISAMPELSGEFLIRLGAPPPYDRLPVEAEVARGVTPSAALAEGVAAAIRQATRASARVTLLPYGALPRTEGKTRRLLRETTS